MVKTADRPAGPRKEGATRSPAILPARAAPHRLLPIGCLALAAAVLAVPAAATEPADTPLPATPQTGTPPDLAAPSSTDAAPPAVPGRHRPPAAAVAEALHALPCTLAIVEEANGRLLVSGTVAGDHAHDAVRAAVDATAAGWEYGFDMAVANPWFCQPLSAVAAAIAANRRSAAPLAMTVDGGETLNAGAPLVLQVKTPDRPVSLRIDYFTSDGSVVHLLPNPSAPETPLGSNTVLRLGNKADGGRYWTIGAPYGQELLVALATPERLFPVERPEQEPAAAYLAALSKALSARSSALPDAVAAASFIRTEP